VQVRRATEDDAAGACAVIRASIRELCTLDHGGDEGYIASWLSNKTLENVRRWIAQSHFFVVEEDGAVVGVGAMTDDGKITLNYVAPAARLRGVSTALLQRLEETAGAMGLETCRLESTRTALRFYEARGYAKVPETYILPLTGTTAVVLAKRL